MANHLDLEEQEQLEDLKHFWKQYGNFITWTLIVVLGCVAAWNGYQAWERKQSIQAAGMFDEVERMVRSGDVEKAERALSDMKTHFAKTTYAQQAGLLVAKMSYDAGKIDAAKADLQWLVDNAASKSYASIARLRLSAVLMESKAYDEALKTVNEGMSEEFAGLVADRRGDIYLLQGKRNEAKTEFQKAFKALDERAEYRRLVEVKLNALGVDATAEAAKQDKAEQSK